MKMQKATKLEERSHIHTMHSNHTYHTPTDVHYARMIIIPTKPKRNPNAGSHTENDNNNKK